jgi:hypothetical protein
MKNQTTVTDARRVGTRSSTLGPAPNRWPPEPQLARRRLLLSTFGLLAASLAVPALAAPAAAEVQVFKSRYCGCCGAWVDHMKLAGFKVDVTLVDDTAPARRRLGMPENFGSCHTATVSGYVLEGHVPAAAVKRLLALRPRAIGLAVPGMPAGSPGMEQGGRRDPYQVLLIDRSGQAHVFAG